MNIKNRKYLFAGLISISLLSIINNRVLFKSVKKYSTVFDSGYTSDKNINRILL